MGSVPVRSKGRKDPRDSRTGSKGELCGLLLFVHNGRECLGDRQDKTICYIRLEGFEKQSVLRSFVEALWSLSYRSAESPTVRYGFSARD